MVGMKEGVNDGVVLGVWVMEGLLVGGGLGKIEGTVVDFNEGTLSCD